MIWWVRLLPMILRFVDHIEEEKKHVETWMFLLPEKTDNTKQTF